MINRTIRRPVVVADIRVPMILRSRGQDHLHLAVCSTSHAAPADRNCGSQRRRDARLWGAPISAKVTRKSAPFRGIQLHGVQPNLDQGAEGSSLISHGKPALAVGD